MAFDKGASAIGVIESLPSSPGGSGSVTAKLRLMTQQLDTIANILTANSTTVISSGNSLIGRVIIESSIPSGANSIGTVSVSNLPTYTEGDTDVSITGVAAMWEDSSDTLRSVSTARPLPVDVRHVRGVISTSNSTTTPLSGNGVFTGSPEDVSDYAAITITVASSHDSASNGLSVEFSPDSTNWEITDKFTISASGSRAITIRARPQYFRIVYTNGSTAQTYFRVECSFHTIAPFGGMFTKTFTVVPTISTSPAYAVNDNIGGKLEFTDALPIGHRSGIIQSVIIADKDDEAARIDVVFFDSNPSGTVFTDNSPVGLQDNDLLKIVGHVRIEPSDYISFANNAVATKSNVGLAINLKSTSLFVAMIIRQGKTFTSTTDLQLKVVITPGEN